MAVVITTCTEVSRSELQVRETTSRSLHVIPSLTLGGAARGAIEIVRGLERRPGFDARLCVLGHPEENPLVASLNTAPFFIGAPVHERGHFLQCLLRLRRLVRMERPDVLHLHLWPSVRIAGTSSIGLPGRILVHIRDTPPAFAERTFKQRLKRRYLNSILTLRNARFVAVSQAAKEFTVQHLGVPAARIDVILNGIDTSTYAGVPTLRGFVQPGVLTLGTAGRLVEAKGHAVLIEAVRLVTKHGRRVRLLIAGSGGLESQLRAQVREAGLESTVRFLGALDDLCGFFTGIDVFVLPSLSAEGLPRVVLEAMTSGRAVIATDAAGVSEVVHHGKTGIMIPHGHATVLASAIRELAADPGRCVNMGCAARSEAMGRYSCTRVVDEIAAYYERLLKEAS